LTTNKEGEILLVKLSNLYGDAREKWNLVGGRVDLNETFSDAIKRETFEESTIIVEDVNEKIDEFYNTTNHIYIFKSLALKSQFGELTSPEIDEVGWFSKEQALK